VILVTVGTNEARFDRLLRALDVLPGGEELVVQHGPSAVRPTGATCVDFLPFDDLAAEIRRARVVITHAGVGSTIASLLNGKRPLVVPRLARHGEAVDDHQVAFGRRLHDAGLVRFVEDPALLLEAVAETNEAEAVALRPNRRLVDEIRSFLDARARPALGGDDRPGNLDPPRRPG
jgi:UDP-N-acetylglucosamine transferase subunit ALG13